MRKLTAILLFSGLSLSVFAGEPLRTQNSLSSGDGGKAFDESSHVINVGVGFNGRSYHSIARGVPGYAYGRTPVMSLSYEQPWPKRLGPGYLGVGAYLAFQHERYEYNATYTYWGSSGWYDQTYYHRHSWNYYMIAGRAAYHWDVLNAEKAEVYAGVVAGVRLNFYSYESNDPDKRDSGYYAQGVAYPAYSVFAGARWYFAKNIGVYAEAGYGISNATVGLSIKF